MQNTPKSMLKKPWSPSYTSVFCFATVLSLNFLYQQSELKIWRAWRGLPLQLPEVRKSSNGSVKKSGSNSTKWTSC